MLEMIFVVFLARLLVASIAYYFKIIYLELENLAYLK